MMIDSENQKQPMNADLIKETVEQAKAQTALATALNALSEKVDKLTESVEKNNEKLERLSVLETSHSNTKNALDRAFKAIADLESHVEETARNNSKEHRTYDRYIWMCIGFATAISVVWSLMGYRLNSTIDKTMESVIRMERHIQTDRVKDDNDVRMIIDGVKRGG